MESAASVEFFVSGMLLGIAAGVSPGPLLALVISETILHGRKEGVLVSAAPAVTDVPIIAVTVFILSRVSNVDLILGAITMAGAIFIGYLACRNIMARKVRGQIRQMSPHSLRRGVVTNFLSPHPYIFWMTVGAPTIMKACKVTALYAVLFIGGFYICLIGSKILVALLVNRSKHFLDGGAYVYIVKGTGIVLLLFAVLFLRDSLILLGVKG